MPGVVWGPHDPHFGESARLASDYLRGQLRSLPHGGTLSIVDIRDVAAAIAAMIEPGRGPRRYATAPHHVRLAELAAGLNRVTGRNIRTVTLPDALVGAMVAPVGLLQRALPFRLPVSTEAINLVRHFPPVDSSRVPEELGVQWTPFDQTLADTITAMVERGQLAAKHAGTLAPVEA